MNENIARTLFTLGFLSRLAICKSVTNFSISNSRESRIEDNVSQLLKLVRNEVKLSFSQSTVTLSNNIEANLIAWILSEMACFHIQFILAVLEYRPAQK